MYTDNHVVAYIELSLSCDQRRVEKRTWTPWPFQDCKIFLKSKILYTNLKRFLFVYIYSFNSQKFDGVNYKP